MDFNLVLLPLSWSSVWPEWLCTKLYPKESGIGLMSINCWARQNGFPWYKSLLIDYICFLFPIIVFIKHNFLKWLQYELITSCTCVTLYRFVLVTMWLLTGRLFVLNALQNVVSKFMQFTVNGVFGKELEIKRLDETPEIQNSEV